MSELKERYYKKGLIIWKETFANVLWFPLSTLAYFIKNQNGINER